MLNLFTGDLYAQVDKSRKKDATPRSNNQQTYEDEGTKSTNFLCVIIDK